MIKDSLIISLTNAIISSNKNYKDYNPNKTNEYLLFTLKANRVESKKLNSIKTLINHKVMEVSTP